jgi:hypothetical protein
MSSFDTWTISAYQIDRVDAEAPKSAQIDESLMPRCGRTSSRATNIFEVWRQYYTNRGVARIDTDISNKNRKKPNAPSLVLWEHFVTVQSETPESCQGVPH